MISSTHSAGPSQFAIGKPNSIAIFMITWQIDHKDQGEYMWTFGHGEDEHIDGFDDMELGYRFAAMGGAKNGA